LTDTTLPKTRPGTDRLTRIIEAQLARLASEPPPAERFLATVAARIAALDDPDRALAELTRRVAELRAAPPPAADPPEFADDEPDAEPAGDPTADQPKPTDDAAD